MFSDTSSAKRTGIPSWPELRGNERQRHESFTPSGPVSADIATRSGDVRIRSHAGRELTVTVTFKGDASPDRLDEVEIDFDQAHNVLSVRTNRGEGGDSMRSLKGLLKGASWFDLGGSAPDIDVLMPGDSSVEVSTASGDTLVDGSLDHLGLASASGDVVVTGTVGVLDVKTASGDVRVGAVRSSFHCRSASGDVTCDATGDDTRIHTASGDVVVTARQAGRIEIRAVSGDVRVSVSSGLVVDVNGNSVAGAVNSTIPLDLLGGGEGDAATVAIEVSTVSGDIRIDKAAG